MSEQDQDLVIGRLTRERSEAKRKLVAMKSELETYHQGFKELANALFRNEDPSVNLSTARRAIESGKLKNLDFSSLLGFLEDYSDTHQKLRRIESDLRELGIH